MQTKRIVIRKGVRPDTQFESYVRERQDAADRAENTSPGLCLLLGILLGPFGVVTAAIISKKAGVIFSLLGCVALAVLCAIVLLAS